MRMIWQSLLLWFSCLILAPVAFAATPPPVSTGGMHGGPVACLALRGTGFAAVTDAPTSITSSTYVEAREGRPAYCALEGYVAPTNGFALWLPTNWNGKFLVRGCGGFCGTVAGEFACKDPIRLGYACLQTDMGHKSTLTDAAWAYNNPQGEIDFAYRSTHATTLAGKAIIESYFQGKPLRAYFIGCSTGGRQGMVEAERFPEDFDGIVAVAPAINETGAAMQLTWSLLANRGPQGNILPPAKVLMLHKAVVDACDMNDGLRDGLIGDPVRCRFRPSSLLCRDGDAPGCLTSAELAVVDKIYAGPSDSHGKPLYHGGILLGSELNWVPSYVGKGEGWGTYAPMMQDFWRYLGFSSDPGPDWTLANFDFDKDPARVGAMEGLFTGANPDLRHFEGQGRKLLLAQGWSDESIVPGSAIDFYQGVTRFMGGPAQTQTFFRMFGVPGMNHCTGGEGAYAINYLAALEDWVEQGKAPDRLVGERPREGVEVPYLGVGLALPPSDVTLRRPYFQWPAQAVYRGKGDADNPDTWRPAS